jgi:hypothetical protein
VRPDSSVATAEAPAHRNGGPHLPTASMKNSNVRTNSHKFRVANHKMVMPVVQILDVSCSVHPLKFWRPIDAWHLTTPTRQAEILEFYPARPEDHVPLSSLSPKFTFKYVTCIRAKPDLSPILLQSALTVVPSTNEPVSTY